MAGSGPGQENDLVVPPLREDLQLLPAGTDEYGAPCWTIHDPVRNRYFRIGYAAFEILRRWHMGRGGAIIDDIRKHTVLTPNERTLADLIRFLHGNGLIQRDTAETVAEFRRIASAGKPPLWKWLIHNYLFIRVPLVHPDSFLRKTRWIADILASRLVMYLIVILGVAGIFLTLRQWDLFLTTFMGFANWQGMVWIAIILTTTKVLHEMGHAYSAVRYGCRVPSMGVAFLVMYPVLYTDTSDAWRLIRKEQRLRIAAAGIRVELALALMATFFWHVVPAGPVQSAVFLLATTTWISTLLINLSPFMRFDGYYLLSDMFGIANLHNRAFAMARWSIREVLFRPSLPPPEPLPSHKRRLLSLFAIAVWVYRFFLFLGIAVVVYHLFFKVLGIVLFLVEICWFIIIPVFKEMKSWWKIRSQAKLTPTMVIVGAVLTGLVVAAFIPWQTNIASDAMLRAGREGDVYTSVAGQIGDIRVVKGQHVMAGEPLAVMVSPELDAEHRIRELELQEAQVRLAQSQTSRQGFEDYATQLQEVRRLAARIAALDARQALLVLRAPIDGIVRELAEDIHVGDWISAQTQIALIIGEGESTAYEVTAYVPQHDIIRLGNSPIARFVPEQISQQARKVRITSIEQFNSDFLEIPALAASNGGSLAAKADRQGRYMPIEPVFRVTGVVVSEGETGLPNNGFVQTRRGKLHLEAKPVSWAKRLYDAVAAGFIRELAF